MINFLISQLFKQLGHTWTLTNGNVVTPTDNDVERVLDEAARQLYNEEVGSRLNVGGLIIEKRENDHDVYIYVGSYQ